MNRRQMALKSGGPFLLQAILRVQRNAFRRRLPELSFGTLGVKDLTPEQSKALHLEWNKHDRFQTEKLPSAMTDPVEELSDSEKAWIRGRFYHLVNMPLSVMRRWTRDPLVVDGADPRYPQRAKRHLRSLEYMKATTRRDGRGWRPRDYDTARRSIFVVQNLLHPRAIDYPTWTILQNFGHDWTRTFTMMPQRRLPKKLEQQIHAARFTLKNRQTDHDHASLDL
jgi:hypothetical protein